MAWRRRSAIVAVLSCGVATLAVSCREATAVVIEARTNAPRLRGTSFTVGGSAYETESAPPSTDTDALDADGTIGTLVVVPGSSDDAKLAIKLVAGVDRPPSQCKPPDYFGCIVARRILQYRAHERLRLPVLLDLDCKNVPCDAVSTCARGACVDATVGCSGDRCNDPGEPGNVGEGGISFVDATSDSSTDARGDAPADAPATDATVDGGKDASSGGTPGKIDCLQSTCNLSAGERCCFDANQQTGFCVGVMVACIVDPMTGRSQVSCDGDEDCNGGMRCCVSMTGLACMATCPYPTVSCHSTGTCATGACTGTFGSYYKVCP